MIVKFSKTVGNPNKISEPKLIMEGRSDSIFIPQEKTYIIIKRERYFVNSVEPDYDKGIINIELK